MGEISTKKTVDEQILERLQALEVLLMEQRKEIDLIKENVDAIIYRVLKDHENK